MPASSPSPDTSTSLDLASVPTKRKLSDVSNTNAIVNGVPKHDGDALSIERLSQIPNNIRDIWDVLKSNEISSPILEYIDSTYRARKDDALPPAKRAKLSGSQQADTIENRVFNNAYRSIDEFVADVQEATGNYLETTIKDDPDMNGSSQWQYWRQDPVKGRLEGRIRQMRNFLRELTSRERSRPKSNTLTNGHLENEREDAKPITNGDTIKKEEPDVHLVNDEDSRTVLTVFANAQGHKQLFSSFQHPPPKPSQPLGIRSSSVSATIPLRENGLPNQISSTKIVRMKPAALDVSQTSAFSFRDLFAASSTLPQLNPPKASRISTTRSNEIGWSIDHPISENTVSRDYTRQKVPTGQWLGYSGIAPAQEPSSPEARRKQRDRTLSSGEATLAPTESLKALRAQAREEALFCSVYSSFAPSKDDSGAIFSEEVKNQIWWQKACHESEDATIFPIDPALEHHENEESHNQNTAIDNEDAELNSFKEIAENYQEPEKDPFSSHQYDQPFSNEVEQKLQDISIMLEKLHSYQRIRKTTLLPTNASSSNLPNRPTTPSSTQTAQTLPVAPSESELALYNRLTHQLAQIVSTLPPSAVSKLAGQPENALLVSRVLRIVGRDFNGVMEEDNLSRLARAAAFQNAITNAKAAANPSLASGASPARTANMNRQGPGGSGYNYGTNSIPRSGTGVGSGNYVRQHQAHHQPLAAWQTPAHNQPYGAQRQAPYTQPHQNYTNRPQPYTNNVTATRPMSSSSGTYAQNYQTSTPTPAQSHYTQRAQAAQAQAAAAGSYGGYGRSSANAQSPSSNNAATQPGQQTQAQQQQQQTKSRPTSSSAQQAQSSPNAQGTTPRPGSNAGPSSNAASPFKPPTANMVSGASPSGTDAVASTTTATANPNNDTSAGTEEAPQKVEAEVETKAEDVKMGDG